MANSKILNAMLNAAKKMNQNAASGDNFNGGDKSVQTTSQARVLSPAISNASTAKAKTDVYYAPVQNSVLKTNVAGSTGSNVSRDLSVNYGKVQNAQEAQQQHTESKAADIIKQRSMQNKAAQSDAQSIGRKKYDADYQKLVNPINDGDSGKLITGNVKNEPTSKSRLDNGKIYVRDAVHYDDTSVNPAEKYNTRANSFALDTSKKYTASQINDGKYIAKYALDDNFRKGQQLSAMTSGTVDAPMAQYYNNLSDKDKNYIRFLANSGNYGAISKFKNGINVFADVSDFAKQLVKKPVSTASMLTDYAVNGAARAVANTIDFARSYFKSAGGVKYPTAMQNGQSPLAGNGVTTGNDSIDKYINNANATLQSIKQGKADYFSSGDSISSKLEKITANTDEKYASLNENIVNKALNDISASVGYMVPSQLANLIIPNSGLALLFASGYSDGYENAVKEGASASDASNYAILNGLNQSLGEELVGGVVGIGSGAVDTLLKEAGINLTKSITNPTVKALAETILSASGEGVEEVGQDLIDTWAKQSTYDKNAENDWNAIAYDGFIGGFMGGFYGGLNLPNAIGNAKQELAVRQNSEKIISGMKAASAYTSTPAEADGIISAYDSILDDLQSQKGAYEDSNGENAPAIFDELIEMYSESKNEVSQAIPEALAKNVSSNSAELSRIAFLQKINESMKSGNIEQATSALSNAVKSNDNIISSISSEANASDTRYEQLRDAIEKDNTVYKSLSERINKGAYDYNIIDSAVNDSLTKLENSISQDKNKVSGLLSQYTTTMSNSVAADILNNVDLLNAFISITGKTPTGGTFAERRRSVKDIAYEYAAALVPVKAANEAFAKGDKSGALKILSDALKNKKAEAENIRNDSNIEKNEKVDRINEAVAEVRKLSEIESAMRNDAYTPDAQETTNIENIKALQTQQDITDGTDTFQSNAETQRDSSNDSASSENIEREENTVNINVSKNDGNIDNEQKHDGNESINTSDTAADNIAIGEKELVDAGYQIWQLEGKRRIYVNDIAKFVDIDGNHVYNGVNIKNSASSINLEYYIRHDGRSKHIKAYYDCAKKRWVCDCNGISEVENVIYKAIDKFVASLKAKNVPQSEVDNVEATVNESVKANDANSSAEVSKETVTTAQSENTAVETPESVNEVSIQNESNPIEPEVKTDESAQSKSDSSMLDAVSDYVNHCIDDNVQMTRTELNRIAQEASGTNLSEGSIDIKEINDAMEYAVNRYILGMDKDSKEYSVAGMLELQGRLPTQTSRSEEQEQYQQFSTPPAIAFVADYAANVNASDIVLEPSAGIGGLAVFAKKDGAKVFVNELSDKRMSVLKNLPFDGFYNENAEQINNILADKLSPSVIIMNPPFSSSAARNVKDGKIGAQHVEAALDLLADGGRLVAITGRGMNDTAPAFRSWWKDIKSKYNVRANIGLDGKNYTKYGTSFGIQMIVIDKTGPTTGNVLTDSVSRVQELQTLLEGIRNDRQGIHTPAEPLASRAEGKADINTRKVDERNSAGERGGEISIPHDSGSGSVGEQRVGLERGQGDTLDASRSDSARTADSDVLHTGSADGQGRVDGARGISDTRGDGHGIAGGGNDVLAANDNESDVPKRGRPAELSESAQAAQTHTAELAAEPKAKRAKNAKKELSDSMFDTYTPSKLTIDGAKPHPSKIAESAAMSAVESPKLTYIPKLPKTLIDNGVLSDVQLEAISYAGQANNTVIADGTRRAFFVGDGTGVGKGREIAGIILDNFRSGRTKAVWVSKNKALLPDCKRDVKGVHGSDGGVTLFEGGKKADVINDKKDGILFTTYNTIGKNYKNEGSNLDKLVKWFDEDYDGVIVFDESHSMANAKPKAGSRGKTKPSEMALAGIELQKRLPNARIIYSSATGATEVSNLAYASRLGLWGEGTTFTDSSDFVGKIEKGGIAAMEVVARSMKAMGVYVSRNLSYDGVSYRPLEHKLSREQVSQYDDCADAWATIASHVAQAIDMTKASSGARSAANSALWGTQQRFFNQVVTSMQVPSMIKDIEKQLANGKSIVIQLTSTNEAATKREMARISADDDINLDDFDSSPRQLVAQYLENSFPVTQYEEYLDENGNKQSRMVLDSSGNPVVNRSAVAARDKLIAKLSDLHIADSPLDMIISHFGSDMVAENTGRTKRVILDKNGNRKIETLSSNKDGDVSAFQDGKKRIIIFSEAGGTGKSYHADRGAKNQQQRVHYLLQAGWKADAAVQGFGRSHRSNESSAPEFVLVQTDIAAQKRFISTIARRLDQLGALTKGQRDTGSQGIFKASDNLENKYADAALENLLRYLVRTSPDTVKRMSLGYVMDNNGNATADVSNVEVKTFLNHLFMLNFGKQTEVFGLFDEFMQNAVDKAKDAGTYDSGMQNYRADRVHVEDTQEIDNGNGAKTQYYRLTAHNKTVPTRFGDIDTDKKNFVGIYQNSKSGGIYAVYDAGEFTNARTGRIERKYRLQSQLPSKGALKDKYEFMHNPNNVKITDMTQARTLWNEKVALLPEETSQTLHLIGGEMLSIWDKLPEDSMRINRILLDDGNVIIGRTISENSIDEVLRRINITPSAQIIDASQAVAALEQNKEIKLNNGWKLKRRTVAGEKRIEIVGMTYSDYSSVKDRYGMMMERAGNYAYHYYMPNDAKLKDTIERVFKSYPAERIINGADDDTSYSKRGARSGDSVDEAIWRAKRTGGNSASITRVGEIINGIRKNFGIPVSTGNFDVRNADAIYKKQAQAIRLRVANDLPNAAHELGHHIDGIMKLSEFESISEVTDKLPAGFAREYSAEQLPGEAVGEFIREYLTNRADTEKKYPKFYEEFSQALSQKGDGNIEKIRRELDPLADKINAYMSADAAEQYDAAMVTSKQARSEPLGDKLHDAMKTAYRVIVDSLDPIHDAVKYARDNLGAVWVRGERDPYVMATNALNVKSIAAYCIKDAAVDMNGNIIGESLMSALSGIRDNEVSEFAKYLMLRHSLEWIEGNDGAYKQVFANPALENPELISSEIAKLEAKHDTFPDTAKRVYDYQKNILHAYCVGGGAMSEEQFKALQEKYPCYVPFQRNIRGKGKTVLPKTKAAFANQSSPVKRAKGSGYEIINILESTVNNTQRMVAFANRNRVMQLLCDMADNVDGFGSVLERVQPDVIGHTVDMKQRKDRLNKLLDERGIENAEELNAAIDEVIGDYVTDYSPILKEGKNIVTVMRDGKKEYYQVHDDSLIKAITQMTPKQAHALLRISAAVMKPTKLLTTSINLTFSLSNPIRDIQTAWRLSDAKNPITFAGAYVCAFKDVITNSNDFKRMKAMGVGFTKMDTDVDTMKKALRNLNHVNENKAVGILRNAVLHPIETMTDIIGIPEAVPRLMEYKAKLKETGDVHAAAYAASDITTNFSRSGTGGRALNDIFMFANASIQGVDRLARAFQSDGTEEGKVKRNARIAKAVITDILMTVVVTALNHRDDEDEEAYKNLSNYQKNNYYCIGMGGGEFVRIPKARETAMLGSLMERTTDYIFGGDEHALEQFGEYIASNVLPPFIPSDYSGYGAGDKAISALHSIVGNTVLGGAFDVAMNKNYLGNPIVSKTYEYLPIDQQYAPTTSTAAIAIGKTLDASPLYVDYLLKNYTGYIGTLLTQNAAVDETRRAKDPLGALGFNTRFTADSAYSTDVFNRVYDARDKAKSDYEKHGGGEYGLKNEQAQIEASFISQANKAIAAHGTLEEQRQQRMILQDYINNWIAEPTDAEIYISKAFGGTEDAFISELIKSELTRTVNGVEQTYTLGLDEFVEMNSEYIIRLRNIRAKWAQYGLTEEDIGDISKVYSDIRSEIRAIYKAKHEADFTAKE